MILKNIFILFVISNLALAQDKMDVKGGIGPDFSEQKGSPKNNEETTVLVRSSRQLRYTKPVNIGASWGLISTWMPSKLGLSASYNYSENKTISAEYHYASIKVPSFGIDLGELREEKYGIMLKSFGSSNSFYASYGLMKYSFRAGLEASLFQYSVPIAKLFDISSIGFQFGLGNQWTWENGISFGVDWFNIYIHAFNKIKNTEVFAFLTPENQSKANDVVDAIYNIPTFDLLKINVSYGF